MPAQRKVFGVKFLLLQVLTFFLLFNLSSNFCYGANVGEVVINEVMWMGTTASANDEWIELRNNTDSSIDLLGWTLFAQDGSPSVNLSGSISGNGYFLLERTSDATISDVAADQVYTGALENGGEYLFLKDDAGNMIDEINASGGWPAGNNSSAANRASMERQSGYWATNDGITINGKDVDGNSIKGTPREANSEGVITPTPTSEPPENSPTPTSTNTPTPTSFSAPTTATYKINEVKDESGNILSSVKIYIDSLYVHHYAPETLEFCDDCYCDQNKQVNCRFGEHVIKLEKSGYQDWSEIKMISSGDSYEVNPIISLLSPTALPISTSAPTVTPISTPTATPTLAPISTKKPASTPAPFGEVLGATESVEASDSFNFLQNEKSRKNKNQEGSASNKSYFWPALLIGLGLILIVGALSPLWLPRCLALLKISSQGRKNEK